MIDFNNFEDKLKEKRETTQTTAQADSAEIVFEEVMVARDEGKPSAASTSQANNIFAVLVVLLALIAPIPLGGARPVPQMMLAIAAAVLCTLQMLVIYRIDPKRKLPITQHAPIAIAGVVFVVGLPLQFLPIGREIGLQDGTFIETAKLTLAGGPSLQGIIRWCSYALVFIVALGVAENINRVERMISWIFYGILVHAVFALITFSFLGDSFLWGEKTYYLGYATGTFVNRNTFATFIGMGIITGIAVTIKKFNDPQMRRPGGNKGITPRHIEAAMRLCMLALMGGALLATQSRAGMAATVVGGVVTLFLMNKKAGVKMRKTALWLVGVGAVLGAVFLFSFGQGMIERAIFTVGDSNSRIELYRQTLSMIAAHPLLGYGFDNYQIAFELFHQPDLNTTVIWDRAHNTYLALWSEAGVILGSIPPVIVAMALVSSFTAWKRREHGFIGPAVACGVIVQAALHSLVDFSFEFPGVNFVFVIILALGVANFRRKSA